MLHVQRFLRTQPLEALTEQYAIKAKRHGQHPNLVLLKYSQIDSPMGERIVQECRGLILDEADDWRIVSAPYWKFFNHGEIHAASVDWATARVYEKLDGSLMTLYWHDGCWYVASSGTPDASGPTDGFCTFAKLFWETWNALGYAMPRTTDHCFMFELMTPANRIVVRYDQPRLVLHGVRNVTTLQESAPEYWEGLYGWECVRTHPFGSLEVVCEQAEALPPLDGEGFIVCDAAFNRVKVKGSQYVALSHLRDSLSERALLEIVRNGEAPEFLAYFPQLQEPYERLAGRYEALVAQITGVYADLCGITAQRDFAAQALPYGFSGRCSACVLGRLLRCASSSRRCALSRWKSG